MPFSCKLSLTRLLSGYIALILVFVCGPLVLSTGLAAKAKTLRSKMNEKRGERRRQKQLKFTATEKAPGLAPYKVWINPVVKPRACLLCIHGLGLHSGSFDFFGQQASKRGLAVYALDVRGFGAWMQAAGKTEVDFNSCLADVKKMLQEVRAHHPGLPVFVLGESMGGAIALRAASLYPELIDGLVSSVPAEERFQQKKTSLKVALSLLRRPGREVNIGTDIVNQATTNESLRDEWTGDPLDRMNLTPKELIQFQLFMNDNHTAAKHVDKMPVLFVQGTKDKLVKPEGTWSLFNELATEDKVFIAVPSEHLIFEEAQLQKAQAREQNLRLVATWLFAKYVQASQAN